VIDITLTEKEAYTAMYAYLVKVYERNQSDDLGALLGDMSTLEDGETADPAVRDEWLECIEQVKEGNISTDFKLMSAIAHRP
jgi:hypothetical protein